VSEFMFYGTEFVVMSLLRRLEFMAMGFYFALSRTEFGLIAAVLLAGVSLTRFGSGILFAVLRPLLLIPWWVWLFLGVLAYVSDRTYPPEKAREAHVQRWLDPASVGQQITAAADPALLGTDVIPDLAGDPDEDIVVKLRNAGLLPARHLSLACWASDDSEDARTYRSQDDNGMTPISPYIVLFERTSLQEADSTDAEVRYAPRPGGAVQPINFQRIRAYQVNRMDFSLVNDPEPGTRFFQCRTGATAGDAYASAVAANGPAGNSATSPRPAPDPASAVKMRDINAHASFYAPEQVSSKFEVVTPPRKGFAQSYDAVVANHGLALAKDLYLACSTQEVGQYAQDSKWGARHYVTVFVRRLDSDRKLAREVGTAYLPSIAGGPQRIEFLPPWYVDDDTLPLADTSPNDYTQYSYCRTGGTARKAYDAIMAADPEIRPVD
jgi:hypothetical protein